MKEVEGIGRKGVMVRCRKHHLGHRYAVSLVIEQTRREY